LSAAEDEQRPLTQCAVRLFGCTSVGKKCIAKQVNPNIISQHCLCFIKNYFKFQLAISAEVNPTEDDIVSTGKILIIHPKMEYDF
jgi:hypothetical protein